MTASEAWNPVYIGLGSNLDEPPEQLRRACTKISSLPETLFVAVSGYYRNPPMGVTAQPDFVNAVAGVLTRLPPLALLAHLKQIEAAQGRVRSAGDRWGPRILDLDLLVYGVSRISEEGLVLPHPGIAERNFVLFPLMEIAPDLYVPGQGRVRDLAARLDNKSLVRVC